VGLNGEATVATNGIDLLPDAIESDATAATNGAAVPAAATVESTNDAD
jgi:hypothetical protein